MKSPLLRDDITETELKALADQVSKEGGDLIITLAERLKEQGRQEVMTLAERLREQGRQEAIALAEKMMEKGREEGIKKGIEKTRREMAKTFYVRDYRPNW